MCRSILEYYLSELLDVGDGEAMKDKVDQCSEIWNLFVNYQEASVDALLMLLDLTRYMISPTQF